MLINKRLTPLVTAREIFTKDAQDESFSVEENAITVYDLPELFLSRGMYFKERKEI